MKLLKTLLVGLLLGISGCSTQLQRGQEVPMSGAGWSEQLPPEAPFPRVAKRSYLYTDQGGPPKGYGAYAYLAFTHIPSVQDKRDRAICEAFNSDFWPAEVSPSVEKRRSEMVTFWPLRGPVSAPGPPCEQLLAKYDGSFGATIAASVGKQGVRGPLLVAWTQPFDGRAGSKEALILDMSGFAIKDFDRAFGIWRDQISWNPKVWQRHWNVILVREWCRNALENYGPDTVTVVATMFNVGKKSRE